MTENSIMEILNLSWGHLLKRDPNSLSIWSFLQMVFGIWNQLGDIREEAHLTGSLLSQK